VYRYYHNDFLVCVLLDGVAVMGAVYLSVFVGAVCLVAGFFMGVLAGASHEYDKWMHRGFVMNPKKKRGKK